MSEATTTLIPYICCRNAPDAVAFYEKAFGAECLGIHKMPDGRVMHAAIKIDGVSIYICEEFPEHGALSPLGLGNSPVTLHLQVADCDAVFNRAVEAGCEIRMPLQDMFWGDRYGNLADPFGHKWSIATTIRQVSPEEMQKALESFTDSTETCNS